MSGASGFLPDHGVNVDVFVGPLSSVDTLSLSVRKETQPWIGDVRWVVVDFRAARSAPDRSEVGEAIAAHEESEHPLYEIPMVFITEERGDTAWALVYRRAMEGKRRVEIVSTVEAAAEITGVPLRALEAEIDRLRGRLNTDAA